jgi:simple sugar transport system permease protein
MIRSSLEMMTPLLLAALGGLFTEKAGSLAICLEGLITWGAFSAACAGIWFQDPGIASIIGLAAGSALAAGFALFADRARANPFIAGLGVNLLAIGLSSILSDRFFGTDGPLVLPKSALLPRVTIGALDGIPVVGELLSGHSVIAWLAWLLVPLSALFLKRSMMGLKIRAAGSSPESLAPTGASPVGMRVAAYAIAGALSGLAGAWISLGTRSFSAGIASGRGWIALVAVFLGFKRPWGIAIACAGFSAAQYLSDIAQASIEVPATLLLALPYGITLVAFAGYSMARRKGAKDR